MADQNLLNQFFQMLESSKSFQLLSIEEQAALKQAYVNATDDQLHAAMQELQLDQIRTSKREAEAKKSQQEGVKAAQEIQEEIKEIEKQELRENVLKEKEKSQKAASDILATLEEEKPKPKKRKKFLGIF